MNMSFPTLKVPMGRAVVPALLALTLFGTGCQRAPAPAPEGRAAEEFLGEDETSAVTSIADRQAAVGARADATLRPYHFDHARLNALGREKLDQIFAGDRGGEGDTVVVYLDLVGDAANGRHDAARRDDVTEYLAAQGLAEDRFQLEAGPNPHNTMFAASAEPPEQEGGGGGGLGEVFAEMFQGMAGAAGGGGGK
jgi:hypothetical protein